MPNQNKRSRAIGVFDSGLGGLTVVKELIRQLPNEHIVYFGDTARVPYGTKSKEAIIRFSRENTQVLLKNRVKLVVVACNSCSSYAMRTLRKEFKIPIVGVLVPGARKAAGVSRNNRVGVLATSATIASGQYPKTVRRFNKKAQVISQACPLFVPIVEEGWFNKSSALTIAREYLRPVRRFKADTLILGCTHYPLMKHTLAKVVGKNVALIDSAYEVANEVKKQLLDRELLNATKKKGKLKFLISDKPQSFTKIARTFLGFELKQVQKVNGESRV